MQPTANQKAAPWTALLFAAAFRLLFRVFAAEMPLLRRVRFPFGLSLFMAASAPPLTAPPTGNCFTRSGPSCMMTRG